MNRILLIDDEPNYRLTLAVLFEEEGFSVDIAGSCAEAMARIEQRTFYDIVLLDNHLGDGTGLDLAPLLRTRLPHAKFMLVTGSTDMGANVPSGIDATMSKDFVFPQLLSRVRELLARAVGD